MELLIPLSEHPSNLDAYATMLVGKPGRSIYRTRDGLVACLRHGLAIPERFTTVAKAQAAQGRAERFGEQIAGRMTADGARDTSDAEIERTLGPCVCGHWLVPMAKVMRDAGALTIEGGSIVASV